MKVADQLVPASSTVSLDEQFPPDPTVICEMGYCPSQLHLVIQPLQIGATKADEHNSVVGLPET